MNDNKIVKKKTYLFKRCKRVTLNSNCRSVTTKFTFKDAALKSETTYV